MRAAAIPENPAPYDKAAAANVANTRKSLAVGCNAKSLAFSTA
jgi:hypothetical protein